MVNAIWGNIFGSSREKKAIIETLRSLPAFEGLRNNDLAQVERVTHERRYSAGESIFDEKMPGAGMYIVLSGEVLIERVLPDGQKMELAAVGEKSFFGELALVDEMPRSAGARARIDSVLLAFCKPDLESLLDHNPALAASIIRNVARMICRRLVETNNRMEALETRVAGLTRKER